MAGGSNNHKKRLFNIFKIVVIIFTVFIIASCPEPMTDDLLAEVEDTVGPIITITSPDPNSQYYLIAGLNTITGTIVDYSNSEKTIGGDVVSASYLDEFDGYIGLDGDITLDENGNFTITFLKSDLDNPSTFTLILSATDWNGNTTPYEFVIWIDNAGPSTYLDGFQDGIYSYSSLTDNFTIPGYVDNDAIQLVCELANQGSAVTIGGDTIISITINADKTFDFSFDPNTLGLTGLVTVEFTATDSTGNSLPKTIYLTEDGTIPAVDSAVVGTNIIANDILTITMSEGIYSNRLADAGGVYGTAAADISNFSISTSGGSATSVSLDSLTTPTAGDLVYTFAISVGGTPDGTETLELTFNSIYDYVGNSIATTYNHADFKLIDKQAPVLTSARQIGYDSAEIHPYTVEAIFSETVTEIGVFSNYTSGANTAATISSSGNIVTLTFDNLILSDGLTVAANTIEDIDENIQTAAMTVASIDDNVDPTIEAITTSTINGIYTVGTTIPITVSFSENVTTSSASLDLSSGSTTASYVSGAGSTELVFDYIIATGNTTGSSDLEITGISGTITDTSGNLNPYISTPFTNYILTDVKIDAVAPEVSIQTGSPLYLKIDGGTIAATIVEVGSGIDTQEWSGDGVVTFADSTAEDPTVTDANEGSQILTLTVTDLAGNIGTDTIQLVWDETPPTISDMGLDLLLNGSGGSIDATAEDIGGSGIISWAWTSTPAGVVFGTPTAEDTTITDSSSDGTYTIMLTVEDAAGNTHNDTISMIWDETSPVISAGDDKTAGTEIDLNSISGSDNDAEATDAGDGGIATYEWTQTDGSEVTITNPYPGSLNPTVNVLSDTEGTYTLQLKVTDNAGNFSTSTMDLTWENGPILTDIVFADDGNNTGAETDDTITFTFDEAIDKNTVGITAANNKLLGTLADLILEVGDFGTDGNIVTGADSEMEYSNASPYTLTITLGTVTSGTTPPSGNFNADDDVEDTSGNLIHDSNSITPVGTFDLTASISSTDPDNSLTTPTASVPIEITVTFSEPINTSGFDFDFTNSSTATITPNTGTWSAGDTVYKKTYSVTSLAGQTGNFTVAATGATDLYGNIQNLDVSIITIIVDP